MISVFNFSSCSDGAVRANALSEYNRLVVEQTKRLLTNDEDLLFNTIRRYYLGIVSLDGVRNAFLRAYGNSVESD